MRLESNTSLTAFGAVAIAALLALGACDMTTGVDSDPPEVTITAPVTDARFEQADTITFQGSATDPEDGPLPGSVLTWKSSLDSTLGGGDELMVAASDLSPGTHTITLAATDSDGVTGSTTIRLVVIEPPS